MALITDKKMFTKGMTLMLSFLVILGVIFSPVFPGLSGQKVNGLDYADNLFNRLSKGSSYFIPGLTEQVGKFEGKAVNLTIKTKGADTAEKAVRLAARAAGDSVTVQAKDATLTVSGSMTKLLAQVLADSDAMFMNKGRQVQEFYGMGEREVMETWWFALSPAIKELQKAKMIEEAKALDTILRKGVEPAYNFYGIEGESISNNILLSAGLLVFYVVYTMWYGFAIFDIFGGIGLTMKKSKVKKEA